MGQITDRELMVAAYQLSMQITKLQKQFEAVQMEIDKRVKEELNGKKHDSSNNLGSGSNTSNGDGGS